MTQPLAVLLALFVGAPSGALDRAAEALADFRPEEATRLLEEAARGGPYPHADHVRLYEQLGIAYAYLERTEEAVAAFSKMLALDPYAAISYTLSPKVTFLFEEARRRAAIRPRPSIDLSWPRALKVGDRVPIHVDVVADPEHFIHRATLFHRLRGVDTYATTDVRLPEPGGPVLPPVELVPPTSSSPSPQTLEVYLVAKDSRGNEVYVYGSPDRPREIALAYEPEDPWYGKWWIWAIAGTVVAAGAGATAFAVTREPPSTIDGTFRVGP